jgi:hypothetical protein
MDVSPFKEIPTSVVCIDQQEYRTFIRKLKRQQGDNALCKCRSSQGVATRNASVSYDCGPDCLNRVLEIECTDRNCNLTSLGAGAACHNRLFSSRSYAAGVIPFKTELKGWGLHCPTADLAAGTFVMEYVGEIINKKMCAERMAKEQERVRLINEHSSQQSVQAAYYFLSLGPDIIIDSSVQGNIARFINHSCNPNCRLDTWNVGGVPRIGIFTQKQIPQGTELTIEYQYAAEGIQQVCCCGESECAGVIGRATSHSKRRSQKEMETENVDDTDDFCAICGGEGDGEELLLCDGKMAGESCKRCYHPKCVEKLTGDPINKKAIQWICPSHFCDDCKTSKGIRYYCATCCESACHDCWLKSRKNPIETSVTSTLHLSRLRPDLEPFLLPSGDQAFYTCCKSCCEDAIVLCDDDRDDFYKMVEEKSVEAIRLRKQDANDPMSKSPATAEALYKLMCDDGYSGCKFIFTYWDYTQKLPGSWDENDGRVWTPQETETDFMQRKTLEVLASAASGTEQSNVE